MLPELIAGNQAVEILLVEDNPSDLRLTLHALNRHRLSNPIHFARDGAEALEFLFGTGALRPTPGAE
jgi:two-component system response regulator